MDRYQRAWAEGDPDAILSMTPEDGVYEASFGPEIRAERLVGPDGPQVTIHGADFYRFRD